MNKPKSLEKLKLLLTRNASDIKRIVVSEELAKTFLDFPGVVDIDKRENEATESEDWFLCGVPMAESRLLEKGAVLEMKDGEDVVLTGI